MKNFQQTPRQRRHQKMMFANQKHQLVASNPKHSFEQRVEYAQAVHRIFFERDLTISLRNICHRLLRRL